MFCEGIGVGEGGGGGGGGGGGQRLPYWGLIVYAHVYMLLRSYINL